MKQVAGPVSSIIEKVSEVVRSFSKKKEKVACNCKDKKNHLVIRNHLGSYRIEYEHEDKEDVIETRSQECVFEEKEENSKASLSMSQQEFTFAYDFNKR